MRLNQEVRTLLEKGREDELAGRAISDTRLVRPLLARLYDPEAEIRRRAASVLGRAAASHPTLGREVTRRLMWALNDESTTNGIHAIPALGQIGRRAPELVTAHVSALARMTWDDGLRLAILEALTEVAGSSPDIVEPELEAIEPHVDTDRTAERTAWQQLRTTVGGERCS